MRRRTAPASFTGDMAGKGSSRSNEGSAGAAAPEHHRPGGGFRNPWHTSRAERRLSLLRWWWEHLWTPVAPNPTAERLPHARSRIASPSAGPGEIRATWIGHSSFLIQVDGHNLLTDPHLSERASPFRSIGPRRLTPPGVPLDALPPIDAVLISHDHYDHLDRQTVAALHARFGHRVTWYAPLRHAGWFARQGIANVVELDWWESARTGTMEVTCLPAQHWTSRTPFDRFRRLWCSWALCTERGCRVYFAGDSGWFPGYREIGERAGPFDLLLLPIGAYEPQWFMRPSHMNPEEAVLAYSELGGSGVMAAMHWGTFRLTDEDPLEPPERLRAGWRRAGYEEERLWIPTHGETRVVTP